MDTVTLQLKGDDIRIEAFARAIDHFSLLIAELSRSAGAEGLRWEVSRLEGGSATTQISAARNGFAPDQVDNVVRSYLEVGRALSESATLPFSPEVEKHARGIAAVLDQGVEAVMFENPEDEAIVSKAVGDPRRAPAHQLKSRAYGAVTGQIQTLTNRNALAFTLYDRLHDRAVRCYLREGQGDLVEGFWKKNATVIGAVTRESETGRPVNVREIETIEPLSSAGAWHRARGVLPPDERTPEDRIREMRDAS